MNAIRDGREDPPAEVVLPATKEIEHAANEITEKAILDAKQQLHPLLRNVEVDRLSKRREFVQEFKRALERRIAQKLAYWQPGVEAVFQFDESWIETREAWDGSIHLLVRVPRLSERLKTIGRQLDESLTRYLKQLGWSRFYMRKSVLEVQQVTPRELRHGISYGAMFCAVHSVPVRVWSSKR